MMFHRGKGSCWRIFSSLIKVDSVKKRFDSSNESEICSVGTHSVIGTKSSLKYYKLESL